MEQFDLKKFLVENKLTTNSALLFEEQASFNYDDIKKKVAPALDKIISTATSKSRQLYDIVKKEISDPENAKKALDTAIKIYNGVKNVADKATNDPNKLRDISSLIPKVTTTALGTLFGVVYKVISDNLSNASSIYDLWNNASLGDPSTILNIGMLLIVLKVIIYALQGIASLRKGTSALQRLFKENEQIPNLDKSNFNDIKAIFS